MCRKYLDYGNMIIADNYVKLSRMKSHTISY